MQRAGGVELFPEARDDDAVADKADGYVAMAEIRIHHVGKGRILFAFSVNHYT